MRPFVREANSWCRGTQASPGPEPRPCTGPRGRTAPARSPRDQQPARPRRLSSAGWECQLQVGPARGHRGALAGSTISCITAASNHHPWTPPSPPHQPRLGGGGVSVEWGRNVPGLRILTCRQVCPQSDVMYISSLYSTSCEPRLPGQEQGQGRPGGQPALPRSVPRHSPPQELRVPRVYLSHTESHPRVCPSLYSLYTDPPVEPLCLGPGSQSVQ